MDVVVNELQSTVEIVVDDALLDPAVLRGIVAAVRSALREDEAAKAWDARERSADGGWGRP
ncbi:hypothetical protein [Mycolicibacterium sp. CR10]|uniref:hypothetical protein n=1 Tax=Mycolicibacterium sp. CR10 TaxID=2562314 RepID=UPI0010C01084|nr:hypothetical protein [Mycolicibacterium sp. CR10]